METFLLIVTVISVGVAVVASMTAWKSARENQERAAARVDVLKTLAFAGEPPAMFGAAAERGAPKRRWAALGAVAVVMLSVAGTVFALHDSDKAAPKAIAATTLDLLTLAQSTDAQGKFVVSGEVRNAAACASLKAVSAHVDLFDQNGRLVAAQELPIAEAMLPPGGESAFTVTLPKAAGVARYRVQFRRPDGSLIPHIDRRSADEKGNERTDHEHAD